MSLANCSCVDVTVYSRIIITSLASTYLPFDYPHDTVGGWGSEIVDIGSEKNWTFKARADGSDGQKQ